MKILAWNCRGMASPAAVRALLDVQKQWGPDVCFLSETQLNAAKAEKLRRKLCMNSVEVVESAGASGGLVLYWKNSVVIEVLAKSKNFIDVKVGTNVDEAWHLTGYYGEPKWEDKHLSWGYIKDLHN